MAAALKTLKGSEPWSPDIKATDDFLDPLFRLFFEKLGLPNLLRKSDYYVLARFLTQADIDAEVAQKLDAIVDVAAQAHPRTN